METLQNNTMPFLSPGLAGALLSFLEKKTTEDKKFLNLKSRNYKELIVPSVPQPAFSAGKESKKYRKRLNKQLEQTALFCLKNDSFIDDLMALARKYELDKRRYAVKKEDFYFGRSPVAVQAWDLLLWHSIAAFLKKHPHTKTEEVDSKLSFEKDVLSFIGSHNLEFHWFESVEALLLSGTWYLPKHASVISVSVYNEFGGIDPQISLQIYKETTQEEIVNRWDEVGRLKKQIYKWCQGERRKPTKNIGEILFENPWDVADKKYDSDSVKRMPPRLRRFVESRKRVMRHVIQERRKQQNEFIKDRPTYAKVQIEQLRKPIKRVYYF